jgi:FkbM family methyltransferase
MNYQRSFKNRSAELCASVVRGYIRFAPTEFGKKEAWKKLDEYFFWRPSFARRTARTKFGSVVDVHLPDTIQTVIYLTGTWEPWITGYVNSQLAPGDIFVDIGANIGYYSLLASTLIGPQGRVYAIEGSPSIFKELQRNVARNAAANVLPIHALASGTVGERKFWSGPNQNLGHSTAVESVAEAEGLQFEATVRAAPVSALVPPDDLRNARMIKIDVEGAELEVMEPLFGELAHFSDRTEWAIELSQKLCPGGQRDVDRIYRAFTGAGYNAFLLPNSYSIDSYLTKARPPRLRQLSEAPLERADLLFSRMKN